MHPYQAGAGLARAPRYASIDYRIAALMRVAVVGAGMAGLACATRLREAGWETDVIDKSRSVGGRLSTRRATVKGSEIGFDHGATHFTARSIGFRRLVEEWEAKGLAARWQVAGTDSWVGTPSMNAPLKDLARTLDVRLACPITALTRSTKGWTLHSEANRIGEYDVVVIAIPAQQAAPLLSLHDFEMARVAMSIRSHPCWSAMFAFAEPLAGLGDFIRGTGSLACAVRESAKPGRAPGERWVVQANWTWSEKFLTHESASICALLHSALGEAAGYDLPHPLHAAAHRWLCAQPSGQNLKVLWNGDIGLGACGDWLHHGFVEYAWQSGTALGETIVNSKEVRPTAGAMPDGDGA